MRVVVFALAVSVVLGGCERQASPALTLPSAGVPTSDFFGESDFLPPHEWAGTPEPSQESDAATVASLSIPELVPLYNRSNAFTEGIAAYPELDPTNLLIGDLPALKLLGDSSVLNVEWSEGDMILAEAESMSGLTLAVYLGVVRKAASEGLLRDHITNEELAESLLGTGYVVYQSESDIKSRANRLHVLGVTWGGAFLLREQAANANGDAESAVVWRERGQALETLVKDLHLKLLSGPPLR